MNDVDIFLNGGLTEEQNQMLSVVRGMRMDIFHIEQYASKIHQEDIFSKNYVKSLIDKLRTSVADGLTMDANMSMFGTFAEQYLARRKYMVELLTKRTGKPMGAMNAVAKFEECNQWLVAHNLGASLPIDAFELNSLIEAIYDVTKVMRKWDSRTRKGKRGAE